RRAAEMHGTVDSCERGGIGGSALRIPCERSRSGRVPANQPHDVMAGHLERRYEGGADEARRAADRDPHMVDSDTGCLKSAV
ncbi:MAG: hypothetical protein HW413_3005, partial [Thermoleophilia bacterium]|nr:hypothetical protein [Thermoleophilia bacterium]